MFWKKQGISEVTIMKKKYRIKSKFRFTLFMTIAILMMISITGTVIGANNAESLTKPVYSEIIVQSGDTLWNLAEEFGPDNKDIREVIFEICELNDISADSIQPGQTILIPVYI
jgi:nucleoid-associated protein YgaU